MAKTSRILSARRRVLRIGIDFDNTIACYDRVWRKVAMEGKLVSRDFAGGKAEIRAAVRAAGDGETNWRRLQGRIYGKHMHEAQLMEGVDDFLNNCRRHGHCVFIVSHKTEYGHFDPERINLRRAAFEWMEGRGFFDGGGYAIDRGNVFFESTREEKLDRIRSLNLDHFIDDLAEVLENPGFPEGPERHRYAANWPRIMDRVFGDAV